VNKNLENTIDETVLLKLKYKHIGLYYKIQ